MVISTLLRGGHFNLALTEFVNPILKCHLILQNRNVTFKWLLKYCIVYYVTVIDVYIISDVVTIVS